jgi:hypothetical protein
LAIAVVLGSWCACSPGTQAFELSDYQEDHGKPVKTLKLKTASNKTIKVGDNAFEKSSMNPFSKNSWNPFSKRNRALKRYEKATRAGGYPNINMPFQSAMWAPKVHNKNAKSGKVAKVAEGRSNKHRPWF